MADIATEKTSSTKPAPVETTTLHHEFILDDLAQEIDPSAVGGSVAELPKGYYRSWSFLGTFAAASLGVMSCYVSLIMPNNILTIINQDLGPDDNYVWVSLVWSLACAVVLAIGGRATDILGRRWFFIVGNGVGSIGAIVAATAHDIKTLVGATALIGIGAGVQTLWPMCLDELVPNKHRGLINVLLWASCFPFSTFGPIIARGILTNTGSGWRGVYWLLLSLSAASTVLFFLFYHPPTFEMLHKGRRKTFKTVLEMNDVGGVVLLSGGLIVFLLGISWGGQQYPWKSGKVIGCIVGGAVLVVIFCFYEIYVPKRYSLMPMHLFRNGPYVALVLAGAFITLNFYTLNILWPIQAAVLYPASAIGIGWLTCTAGAGAYIGQIIAGMLIRPVKYHRFQVIFYAVMGTAFTAAMGATTPHTRAMGAAFTFFSGFSVGAIEAVIYTLCPLTCAPEDIGLAIGTMLCVRLVVPSITVAIDLTVLTNKLATNIPKYVVPAAVGAGLPASDVGPLILALTTGDFSAVSNISSTVIAAATGGYQEAYTHTFKVIYLSTLAWGAVAILCACFTPDMGSHMTDFVGRRLHGRDIDAIETKKQADGSNLG